MQVKNTPAISTRYWVAILAANMCGTNTGDFRAESCRPGRDGTPVEQQREALPLACDLALDLADRLVAGCTR